MANDNPHEALWRSIMLDADTIVRRNRALFSLLPSDHRCTLCKAPFNGAGGVVARHVFHRHPGNLNPEMCNACEEFFETYPGGAEVEVTLMFADVRGSTTIAEGMSPAEFSRLMGRFYTVSAEVVGKTNGLIEKFVGDEAATLFPPGISGPDHAQKAVEAARLLLEATGHGNPQSPAWLPVGAGIHTGTAFVGTVGEGGVAQFTALGDAPNTAARLASNAAAGEILISEDTARAAGLSTDGLEFRELMLKGRQTPIHVYVMRLENN